MPLQVGGREFERRARLGRDRSVAAVGCVRALAARGVRPERPLSVLCHHVASTESGHRRAPAAAGIGGGGSGGSGGGSGGLSSSSGGAPMPGVRDAVNVRLARFTLDGPTDRPPVGRHDPSPDAWGNNNNNNNPRSLFPTLSPSPPPCSISASDLKQFLAYASTCRVELTPEAKKLITGYYIFSRRRRNNNGSCSSVGGVDPSVTSTPTFPVAAIASLTSLAVAHAKLRVHSEVNVDYVMKCVCT